MLLALEFLTGVFSMFLICYLLARMIEIVFHVELIPDDTKNRTIEIDPDE